LLRFKIKVTSFFRLLVERLNMLTIDAWLLNWLIQPRKIEVDKTRDVTRSKNVDPGRFNFLFLRPGQVSQLWFGSGFGKFPLKISIFSIFLPLSQKNQKVPGSKTGRPLIYCLSKVRSGRVRPISSLNTTLTDSDKP